jgi:predicted Zn-dependent protease
VHADRGGVDLGEAFSSDDDFTASLGDAGLAAFRVRADRIDAGPIEADRLLCSAVAARRFNSRVLIITNRDLKMRGLASLFGFADRQHDAAVISTARLSDPGDSSRLAHRLANVARHEIGHLNGLRHCRGPRCVMMAVSTPAELDARAAEACGLCPRRSAWARRIAGLAAAFTILLLSVVALDRVTSKIAGPAPDFPFL